MALVDTLWSANYNPPLGFRVRNRRTSGSRCDSAWMVFSVLGVLVQEAQMGFPIGGTGPNKITTAVAKRYFEVMVSRMDVACGLTSSLSVASQIHLADCRCMERSSNE